MNEWKSCGRTREGWRGKDTANEERAASGGEGEVDILKAGETIWEGVGEINDFDRRGLLRGAGVQMWHST